MNSRDFLKEFTAGMLICIARTPCCGFITRSLLFILTPMAVLSLVVPRFTKDDGGQVSDKLGVLNKDPCCGFHK